MSDQRARSFAASLAIAVATACLIAAVTSALSAPNPRAAKLRARAGAGAEQARWRSVTIPSGAATLAYPASWAPIPGDAGTATVALRDHSGRYAGYLNVTPRQGAERLAGWAAFRIARNEEEGDTELRLLTATEGVRFIDARGSCVLDQYRSRVGAHAYRELACIVSGRTHTSVFVGAALVSAWPAIGPVLKRAARTFVER